MKSRTFLYSMLMYSSLTIAQPIETPRTEAVVIPSVKLCSSIEQIFGFKNDAPIKLDAVKKFLQIASKHCTFVPRATAEEIMQLPSADNIYYSCKDISVETDFTADVSFSYTSQAGPVTQTIKLRLVPPDETPPSKLEIPPAPATPTTQPSSSESLKNTAPTANQPQ